MTTFFSGPRDGQLDKNLQAAALMAVNFFSKKLNIHRLRTNIHVKFHHNLYVDNSHSEGLCESVDPRNFIIDIALYGNWMSTLAHELVHVKLMNYKDADLAIRSMTVRGAPLIGATAAYGIYLAVRELIEEQHDGEFLDEAFEVLRASRRDTIGKLSGWKTGAARTPGSEQKIVHNYDVKYMGHHYGASYIEHTKFRDAILNSTPAEVTLKDGVTSVVTGLAAHKSINEGRVVEIKELWG